MINKKIAICFIFSLILTIGFPVGIVLICVANKYPIGLISGIILTAVGFYGMPLLWLKFANLNSQKKLCNLIVKENIQEISALAKINNVDNAQIIAKVNELINNRYLSGYEIVDDKFVVKTSNKVITRTEAERITKNTSTIVCPGCGAPVEVVEGQKMLCPYCGRPMNK